MIYQIFFFQFHFLLIFSYVFFYCYLFYLRQILKLNYFCDFILFYLIKFDHRYFDCVFLILFFLILLFNIKLVGSQAF
jgi:hypothetical protein